MKELKLLLCFFLLLSVPSLVYSQRTVSGRVTDTKDNSPLVDATVSVVGQSATTKTTSNGSFTLNVPAGGRQLRITYIGYTDQIVDITSGPMNITMSTSTQNLTDVVVIGYGSVRKRDLTGSVSSVQAKDFNTGQINSPEQLLQGKVAGLQITNSSGQPGGVTIVKIRGNNSIRTGNTPLYVVDGVPLDGRSPRPGYNASGLGNTPGGDPLTFINPNEIASIDVLKDASASAIYGSRGANGVILITTKKGATGAARLEAAASVGVGNIMRRVDVLDASEYRSALKQFNAPLSDSGANIDPFSEIIRQAVTQNYSVALSGGSENGKYRASFFAGNQDGIILKTNLKKYVANFNGQYRFLNNKLSVDFSATAANVGEHIAPISNDAGSNGNLISLAMIWNPTLVLKRSNGLYNQTNPSGQVNPLAFSEAYNDLANQTTILGNINAGYKITPWLEYRMLYGINYGNGNRKAELQGWIKGTGGVADAAGAAFVANAELSSQIITHTLNLNKKISSSFNLNALVGYEYWKTGYKGNNTGVYGFDYNLNQANLIDIHYFDNMQDGKQANMATGSFKDPTVEIQSYFTRAVLNYQDKYLLTATLRADGSSKFGSDNKYAYFPSLAFGWNISNESFMKNNTVFNSLKLRAGYGETGNQEFPPDAPLDVYRYNSNGSIGTSHFGNNALKWETVKSIDLGLDYAFWKGRVYGAIDYFYKKTEDPIFLAVVSQPTGGGGALYKNLDGAAVINKGVEFSVGADVVKAKDFSWSLNTNVTFVKNKFDFPAAGTNPLAFTGGLHGQGSSGAYSQAIAHNQPINVYFTPTFSGFDKDGIGIYSANPEYNGDPNPSCFLGFSTDLAYKKFSLNLGAHGSFGNKLFNNTAMSVLNISNINGGRNIASGLVTAGENPANAITPSTRFLESGNYLKLHNATLRYNFGNIGNTIKGFSAYVSGNNLFVISKYKGFDPEVNVDKSLNGIPSLGVDYIGYPTQRTFLFGVNFSL
jgi:TonB-linked SusC/RagA family outer membrane protein